MSELLPTVDFFGTSVSKLIIGGNPVSGHSHQNDALDAEMVDYFTTERVKEMLRECERNGINTFQFRADRHLIRLVREYRNEGGTMNWICQTASEYANLRAINRSALGNEPIAFYLHGTQADNYWKTGQVDRLRADLDILRETGLPVGLGSHMPEMLMDCEEHDWGVDFYMTCMYNLYKLTPGWRDSLIVSGERQPEVYDDKDRDRMLAFVRQVDKPCLLFKVLAAGRNAKTPESLRATFRYVIENSKPCDALVVGMFPKQSNQMAENAAIIREVVPRSE
jgi:hypothetical protein